MTDYRKLHFQILMYLTTVAQFIQEEFQEFRENQELKQVSFESLERCCYLKGQIDLLDNIERTITRLKSQD